MTDVCPSSKQTFLMLPPEKTRGSRSDHPRSQLYHCSQLTGDKFRPEASVVSPLVTFAAARLYCRDSAGEKFTGRRLIPPDGKKWRSEARTNVGTRIFAAESLHQGENFRLLGPCVTGRKQGIHQHAAQSVSLFPLFAENSLSCEHRSCSQFQILDREGNTGRRYRHRKFSNNCPQDSYTTFQGVVLFRI